MKLNEVLNPFEEPSTNRSTQDKIRAISSLYDHYSNVIKKYEDKKLLSANSQNGGKLLPPIQFIDTKGKTLSTWNLWYVPIETPDELVERVFHTLKMYYQTASKINSLRIQLSQEMRPQRETF